MMKALRNSDLIALRGGSSLDGKGNDVLTEDLIIVIEYFEEA